MQNEGVPQAAWSTQPSPFGVRPSSRYRQIVWQTSKPLHTRGGKAQNKQHSPQAQGSARLDAYLLAGKSRLTPEAPDLNSKSPKERRQIRLSGNRGERPGGRTGQADITQNSDSTQEQATADDSDASRNLVMDGCFSFVRLR